MQLCIGRLFGFYLVSIRFWLVLLVFWGVVVREISLFGYFCFFSMEVISRASSIMGSDSRSFRRYFIARNVLKTAKPFSVMA